MIDYKLIADNDPGGDLETAFAQMQAETVTVPVPGKRQTYLSIADEVGFAEAAALSGTVEAEVTAKQLPKWVDVALEQDGIDVTNPQVGPILSSLVNETLTQTMVDAIIATGSEDRPKYPGLRIGYLADARRKRERGEI